MKSTIKNFLLFSKHKKANLLNKLAWIFLI